MKCKWVEGPKRAERRRAEGDCGTVGGRVSKNKKVDKRSQFSGGSRPGQKNFFLTNEANPARASRRLACIHLQLRGYNAGWPIPNYAKFAGRGKVLIVRGIGFEKFLDRAVNESWMASFRASRALNRHLLDWTDPANGA